MPESQSSPRDEILAAFELALDTQLRAVRRLRGHRPMSVRPGPKGLSNIDMSFEVLRRTKTPMHVNDLIVAIAQAYGVQPARDSLVSALTKKVMAGDRFEKTGPNTFGVRADALA
jgi:hypothetical protein